MDDPIQFHCCSSVKHFFTSTHTMGKKKAPVFRDASAKNKSNQDEGASIKAIRTWDDIEHDSEDECRWIYTSLLNDRSLFLLTSHSILFIQFTIVVERCCSMKTLITVCTKYNNSNIELTTDMIL